MYNFLIKHKNQPIKLNLSFTGNIELPLILEDEEYIISHYIKNFEFTEEALLDTMSDVQAIERLDEICEMLKYKEIEGNLYPEGEFKCHTVYDKLENLYDTSFNPAMHVLVGIHMDNKPKVWVILESETSDYILKRERYFTMELLALLDAYLDLEHGQEFDKEYLRSRQNGWLEAVEEVYVSNA